MARLEGNFHARKMPAEPTMCMKTQELRGNSMFGRRILSDSIKDSYIVASKTEREKIKLKIGDDPTMYMKTKENGRDILDDPTMFMKTNGLILEPTICLKIKGLSSNRQVESSDGGACVKYPSTFVPSTVLEVRVPPLTRALDILPAHFPNHCYSSI